MRFSKVKVLVVSLCSLFAAESFAACKYTNSINIQPVHVNNINSRMAFIWLANTSKESVDVSVKLFDGTGTDVTASVVTGGNPERTLVAKGSNAYQLLGNGATRTLWGRLTWTSTECLTKPLIGNMETQWGNAMMSIPLQQGKRF